MPVSQRALYVDEISAAYKSGELKEIFGTGTAAVISPVGELALDDQSMKFEYDKDSLAHRLYAEITAIQYGEKPDVYNWLRILK